MAHSPHRHRKGCGLCKPHKLRSLGRGERDPFREVRKLGKRKRLSRGYLDPEG